MVAVPKPQRMPHFVGRHPLDLVRVQVEGKGGSRGSDLERQHEVGDLEAEVVASKAPPAPDAPRFSWPEPGDPAHLDVSRHPGIHPPVQNPDGKGVPIPGQDAAQGSPVEGRPPGSIGYGRRGERHDQGARSIGPPTDAGRVRTRTPPLD